jgi:hypothetical protein
MAKKKTAATATSLADIYNEVSRRADKQKIHINVAETKRVLACFFDVLENQKPAVAFDIIAKGLQRAGTRRR